MIKEDAGLGKLYRSFCRGFEAHKAEGLRSLVIHTVQYIYIRSFRKIIPGKEHSCVPGIDLGPVLVGQPQKSLDKFFPRFKVNPTKELGLRMAHTFLTRPGDRVVIIGGGEGLTAVVAAKIVGESGTVHVYDGLNGEDDYFFGVSKILANARLNHVGNLVSAEWAFVSSRENFVDFESYEKAGTVPALVHPKNLPDCDVLEMDANAAELEILETMEIRPRVIIFELEAPFYKGYFKNQNRHPFEIFNVLERLGYSVIKQTGHEGINLTKHELIELVERQYDSEKKATLKNGAKDSPVLYCVKNDASLVTIDQNSLGNRAY